MKTKSPLLILAVILLTSCMPSPTAVPESTPTVEIIPTVTLTLTPINTPAPSFTLTPTSLPIPDYMKDFIDDGYATMQVEPNAQYLVFHLKDVKFAKNDTGILFHGIRIFSWNTVSYFENGEYREGIVLNQVCRVEGANAGRHASTLGDNVNLVPGGNCPSMDFFKSKYESILALFGSDYFIAKVLLGTGNNQLRDMLFEGVFPNENGVFQTVNIPEIGEVLPSTQVDDFINAVWK